MVYGADRHVAAFVARGLAETVYAPRSATQMRVLCGTNLATYTRHLTFWDGDNANLKNATETFILEVRLVGSDSSLINGHPLEHATINATGATLKFSNAACA